MQEQGADAAKDQKILEFNAEVKRMLEQYWGAPFDKQMTMIRRARTVVHSALVRDGLKLGLLSHNENNEHKMHKI